MGEADVETTAPVVRLLDDSFLRFLPAPLREPRRAWLAILIGFVLTITGSLALSYLSQSAAPGLPTPEFPVKGWVALFALVVFAPFVETLIMAAAIEILLLILPPRFAVIASATGWGIAHSLAAAAWGLVIWWPFLIFSTLYVTWRGKGRAIAIAIVFAVHALNNLGPALLLLRSA